MAFLHKTFFGFLCFFWFFFIFIYLLGQQTMLFWFFLSYWHLLGAVSQAFRYAKQFFYFYPLFNLFPHIFSFF